MISKNINKILEQLPAGVKLCAVSKTKPEAQLMEAYAAGQRIFGENKIQELVLKQQHLPKDIQWHYIGHLQRNKVKFIAPYVSLIHGCDSLRLLEKIEQEGEKNNRKIEVLLQIHIAKEQSKFGLTKEMLFELLASESYRNMNFIEIRGLMGMATRTDNLAEIKSEFEQLASIYKEAKARFFSEDSNFSELSMGMSGDYKIAIGAGSTIVRVGSAIFGTRG